MSKRTFLAAVGQSTFELSLLSEHALQVDGRALEFDLEPLSEHSMSLILAGKTYSVEILSRGKEASVDNDGLLGRTVVVSIKGKEYRVLLDNARSLLFKKFATKAHAGSESLVIRAPMPGLISKIEVQSGEEVSKGQGLLVLEAMKMENEIRSTVKGRVKAIHAKKGKPVEKNEALITIEEI